MSFFTRIRLIFAVFFTVLLATGCFYQKTPAEKMYKVLEKVVSVEKAFEKQQKPLMSLEKKEKVDFDKIMSLGMKQFDQVVRLSDDAYSMADKRKELMGKEEKSMKDSKAEFVKAASVIKELETNEQKKKAKNLYSIMMQRYTAHDVLYNEYIEGVQLDQELYKMLKNQNITLDALEAQINKINDKYKKIFAANEKFNELTEKYNNQKNSLYKSLGLKISEKK